MNTLQRSSEIMGRASVRMYWLSDCSEQWVRKGKREEHGKADWMCLVNVRGVVYVAGGSESLDGHIFSSKELPANV